MKKILLMVVIGIVLIGGSIGGTLVLTGALHKKTEEGQATAEGGDPAGKPQLAVKPLRGPAIYQPIDPPFVVNFEDQGIMRYVQVGLTTMTRDPRIGDILIQNMPQIRNNLILLFSNQKLEVLSSLAGKEKLRQQALAQIQGILTQEVGIPGVEALYFTVFVLQ